MNLIRLVKMKLISGELDGITDNQKKVISTILSLKLHEHIFNFQYYYKYTDDIIKGDTIYIEYDKTEKIFLFRYSIWFNHLDVFRGVDFITAKNNLIDLMETRLGLRFKITIIR